MWIVRLCAQQMGSAFPTFTYTIAKQPHDVLSTADGSGEAPDLSQGVRNYS